jgi:hypothetical protein
VRRTRLAIGLEQRRVTIDATGRPSVRKTTSRRALDVTARPPSAKTIRQLWGKAKGQFRTGGRFASASIRGTVWLTRDRCDGTLVQVKQGVVKVADFVKRKTVTVRSGKSYLAKR